MKKNNIIVVTLCLLATLLFSCAEQDVFDKQSKRTVDVNLEVAIADLVQTKSGALEGDEEEVPYCVETTFEEGDMVDATYTVTYNDGAVAQYSLSWTAGAGDYDRMSELIQIDFTGNQTGAVVTFNDFRVTRAGTLIYIAPTATSAYAGYVTNPIGTEYEVGEYEKVYMFLEVLCFNEEDIPLFGFAWTDFDVVTGDEVYFFFNCMGETASTLHQVMPADVTASFYTSTGWVEYWSGSNYTLTTPLTQYPFAIPCPGNWKDYGIKLSVKPLASAITETFIVAPETLEAAIPGVDDSQDATYSADSTNFFVNVDVAEDYNDNGDDYYIHYNFKDCNMYKPQVYYSNNINDGGVRTSKIYAISWEGDVPSDDNFKATYLFTEEGGIHIAMAEDQSKLILVNRNATIGTTNNFYIYDIYSLQSIALTYDATNSKVGEETYQFTQLVYVNDQLYAGCQTNNCLVPVDINYDNNTYALTEDIINMDDPAAINGGDLIGLSDNTKLASLSQSGSDSYIIYDITGGMQSTYSNLGVGELSNVSGACTTPNGGVVTSHYSSGVLSFKYWENNGSPSDVSVSVLGNGGIEEANGGDMASAFEGLLSESDFKNIFGD